jgi:hypothetical protein
MSEAKDLGQKQRERELLGIYRNSPGWKKLSPEQLEWEKEQDAKNKHPEDYIERADKRRLRR